jgi:hypothetical protein
MKYIKAYESLKKRKFKANDIVKYKYSDSQPFQIIDWIEEMREYRVKDLYNNNITFFKPNLIEIYPPEKIENFWSKKNAEKYNL